jgi:hypothetical protein
MTDHDRLARVEAACIKLAQAGHPITFDAVAGHAEIGRATLYRRQELRAVVEEHRARGHEANTLSGLARDIDDLRSALDAVAGKVRRHEETLRGLTSNKRTR